MTESTARSGYSESPAAVVTISAPEAEDHEHGPGGDGDRSGREEAAIGGEVRQTGRGAAADAEQPAGGDDDEGDDRRDLVGSEPELELAVGPDRTRVSDRQRADEGLINQIGASIRRWRMVAPAAAPTARTIAQK